jgi:hypothetical protein
MWWEGEVGEVPDLEGAPVMEAAAGREGGGGGDLRFPVGVGRGFYIGRGVVGWAAGVKGPPVQLCLDESQINGSRRRIFLKLF